MKKSILFSWEKTRYAFLSWLSYKVAKTEIDAVPPKWIRFLHFILFPFHNLYERQSQVHYSLLKDVYTIRGVKISGAFIEDLRRNNRLCLKK